MRFVRNRVRWATVVNIPSIWNNSPVGDAVIHMRIFRIKNHVDNNIIPLNLGRGKLQCHATFCSVFSVYFFRSPVYRQTMCSVHEMMMKIKPREAEFEQCKNCNEMKWNRFWILFYVFLISFLCVFFVHKRRNEINSIFFFSLNFFILFLLFSHVIFIHKGSTNVDDDRQIRKMTK